MISPWACLEAYAEEVSGLVALTGNDIYESKRVTLEIYYN